MAFSRARRGLAGVAAAGGPVDRLALARRLLPFAACGLFLWLVSRRLAEADTRSIFAALAQVSLAEWAAALAMTGLSFWAIGQYDSAIHRHLATGIAPRRARRAGIIAIALSQTLGLGLLTGTLVRYRMLPGTTLLQAGKLTVAVALSFLTAWAVVTALATLLLPLSAVGAAAYAAAIVIALVGAALILSLVAPPLRIRGRTIAWPSLVTSARILTFTAVDTIAAAAALWILLPAAADPGFAVILPAFLVALGAGLIANTPGGLGAFELTMLALLPGLAEEPLLAAILAYRAAYFALPACLAAAALAHGPWLRDAAAEPSTYVPGPAHLPASLNDHPGAPRRAETDLLRQGDLGLLLNGTASVGWMAGSTRQCLTAIGEPFGAADAAREMIERLTTEAESRALIPALYKTGARTAAHARRVGWQVMRCGSEAHLDPARFDLAAPSRASLRRKLRKAEKAGVSVTRATGTLPWAELHQIARAWADARGGERGFSMGRWERDYVAGQAVWIARQQGRAVAFVSFHPGAAEWALDLLRALPNVPDGTMQALILAAIRDAAGAGIPRLSLAAAAPEPPPTGTGGALLGRLDRLAGLDGLRRFKAGFAPQWQPLYAAAPSRLGLMIAMADVLNRIARPAPHPAAAPPVWAWTGAAT